MISVLFMFDCFVKSVLNLPILPQLQISFNWIQDKSLKCSNTLHPQQNRACQDVVSIWSWQTRLTLNSMTNNNRTFHLSQCISDLPNPKGAIQNIHELLPKIITACLLKGDCYMHVVFCISTVKSSEIKHPSVHLAYLVSAQHSPI